MRAAPVLAPVTALAALFAAGCQKVESHAVAAPEDAAAAPAPAAAAACADPASLEQLKRAAFTRAGQLRQVDPAALDRLAGAAAVRLDEAVSKQRDDALDVTVCAGRLTVALPAGTRDPFSGATELSARVSYAVQRTADRSLRVQRLAGAEPIAYPIAALALPTPQPAAQPAAAAPALRPAVAQSRPAPPPPGWRCDARARTHTEYLLCANASLAALDRRTAALHGRAMASADGKTRERLQRTRARFLARLERCRRLSCAEDVYEDRIEQIQRIAF
jgi:hypothetical protein